MHKNAMSIELGGVRYVIRSDRTPEQMQSIADAVQKIFEQIQSATPHLTQTMQGLLTAFEFADQCYTWEQQAQKMKNAVPSSKSQLAQCGSSSMGEDENTSSSSLGSKAPSKQRPETLKDSYHEREATVSHAGTKGSKQSVSHRVTREELEISLLHTALQESRREIERLQKETKNLQDTLLQERRQRATRRKK